MADPAVVPCPADEWTKVATNVVQGLVTRLNSSPSVYKQTYRDTGGAAPTVLGIDAIPIFAEGISVPISATAGIDVYIYPVGAAGSVRVDV